MGLNKDTGEWFWGGADLCTERDLPHGLAMVTIHHDGVPGICVTGDNHETAELKARQLIAAMRLAEIIMDGPEELEIVESPTAMIAVAGDRVRNTRDPNVFHDPERLIRAAFRLGFTVTRDGFNGECPYDHLAPTRIPQPGDGRMEYGPGVDGWDEPFPEFEALEDEAVERLSGSAVGRLPGGSEDGTLDVIAETLNEEEDALTACGKIADLLRATGREITPDWNTGG